MDIITRLGAALATVYSVLVLYRVLYTALGALCRGRTFPEAKKQHTYGIVIAARNEERVIGKLLDSIRLQDYDSSLIRVYVVADNSTDRTAEICREHGAIVYERHDPSRARKGYALEFLFDAIDRDYGIDSVDAYIFFDADNLLRSSFVTEMNRAFDYCGDVAVGYRNTKNFDTNFISAAYGIHFYESTMTMHRPRALLGLSTHVAGCGYAVSSRLLAGGWHWTCLTEDTQFCLTQISRGVKIEFCEAAEFFDEQPYSLDVMVRQRLRWAKGRLACFLLLGAKLLRGIFTAHGRRFCCYDIFMYIFPHSLITALTSIALALIRGARELIATGALGLPSLPGLLSALAMSWLGNAALGAVIVIRERRHISCSGRKLALYTLLWPFFEVTALPIAIASLFMRVKWKPIRHDHDVDIAQLERRAVRI